MNIVHQTMASDIIYNKGQTQLISQLKNFVTGGASTIHSRMKQLIPDLQRVVQSFIGTHIYYSVDPSDNMFSVTAPGGTGKTTCSYAAFSPFSEQFDLILAAPTHATKKVIDKAWKSAGYDGSASTVSRVLGISHKYDKNGNDVYERGNPENSPLVKAVMNAGEHQRGVILILDEASLLSDTNYNYLAGDVAVFNGMLKIVFLMDDMQLPPVEQGEEHNNKSKAAYVKQQGVLSEIMRAGNRIDLKEAYMKARSNIGRKEPWAGIVDSENVLLYPISHFDDLLRFYGSNDDVDTGDDDNMNTDEKDRLTTNTIHSLAQIKIICYHNETARRHNAMVRRVLHGNDVQTFVAGDKLIFTAYCKIMYASESLAVVGSSMEGLTAINFYQVGDEKVIVEATPINKGDSLTGREWRVWRILLDDGTYIFPVRDEDREEAIKCYIELKDKLKGHKRLLKRRKKDVDSDDEDGQNDINTEMAAVQHKWTSYYSHKNAFLTPITYGYANNVHKAQGSEYPLVFVDIDDFSKNIPLKWKPLIRGKAIYTAISRAKEKVVLFLPEQ